MIMLPLDSICGLIYCLQHLLGVTLTRAEHSVGPVSGRNRADIVAGTTHLEGKWLNPREGALQIGGGSLGGNGKLEGQTAKQSFVGK